MKNPTRFHQALDQCPESLAEWIINVVNTAQNQRIVSLRGYKTWTE